ncbi:hypothetical protein K474DRAFT_479274 [Panus rudis PR-1116 ss-1]|nr:hypothetical protein K474DRAFT_479274 [Panus rudis PR-1116 ss-1]
MPSSKLGVVVTTPFVSFHFFLYAKMRGNSPRHLVTCPCVPYQPAWAITFDVLVRSNACLHWLSPTTLVLILRVFFLTFRSTPASSSFFQPLPSNSRTLEHTLKPSDLRFGSSYCDVMFLPFSSFLLLSPSPNLFWFSHANFVWTLGGRAS